MGHVLATVVVQGEREREAKVLTRGRDTWGDTARWQVRASRDLGHGLGQASTNPGCTCPWELLPEPATCTFASYSPKLLLGLGMVGPLPSGIFVSVLRPWTGGQGLLTRTHMGTCWLILSVLVHTPVPSLVPGLGFHLPRPPQAQVSPRMSESGSGRGRALP